jgi:hypothetical protein
LTEVQQNVGLEIQMYDMIGDNIIIMICCVIVNFAGKLFPLISTLKVEKHNSY